MAQKSLQLILLTLLILIFVMHTVDRDSKLTEPSADTLKEAAAIYGELNPQVASIKREIEVSHNWPMYFVELKGDFNKDNLHVATLHFSMLANRKFVWCLTANDVNGNPVWEDADVKMNHAHSSKK